MFKRLVNALGRGLAHYLNQPIRHYEPFAISDPVRLAAELRPADVLLVDGNSRVSTAIKYLTQSTWPHVAMYAGDFQNSGQVPAVAPVLIEADLEQGVIGVSLNKYAGTIPVSTARWDWARTVAGGFAVTRSSG